jgi:hypothetical protein
MQLLMNYDSEQPLEAFSTAASMGGQSSDQRNQLAAQIAQHSAIFPFSGSYAYQPLQLLPINLNLEPLGAFPQ